MEFFISQNVKGIFNDMRLSLAMEPAVCQLLFTSRRLLFSVTIEVPWSFGDAFGGLMVSIHELLVDFLIFPAKSSTYWRWNRRIAGCYLQAAGCSFSSSQWLPMIDRCFAGVL
ncbi:hypothetical protein HAX54_024013 [Datura stramonium]|uniref:Uncharacterized protein n=1 Tax=Datura stramonium TaxID=4076 RepID=A0ABS8UZS0_DATST|nr:hypothetical protein [Datura stramonium]